MGRIDSEAPRHKRVPESLDQLSHLKTYNFVARQQANYDADPLRSRAYPLDPFDLPHESAVPPKNSDQ